jgi:hypothetical protein
MTPSHKLQELLEETIDIQLQIRDLEQKKLELKKKLNGKLTMLLNFKKILKQVKTIDKFNDHG